MLMLAEVIVKAQAQTESAFENARTDAEDFETWCRWTEAGVV